VCIRPQNIPVILGGNSPKALKRAALIADGWYSAGTPSLTEACRIRDELMRIRDLNALRVPYRCYFRLEAANPELADRYADEGITDLVVWSEHVWPPGESTATKTKQLRRCAADLGIEGHGPLAGSTCA